MKQIFAVLTLAFALGLTPAVALAEEVDSVDDSQQVAEVAQEEEQQVTAEATTTVQEDVDQSVVVSEQPATESASEPTSVVEDQVVEPTQDEQVMPQDDEATETDLADSDASAVDSDTTDEEALDESSDNIPATPSEAVDVDEGTYVIQTGMENSDHTLSRLVMDAKGGTKEGAEVITWTYNGGGNQKWNVSKDTSGWYKIASYADPTLVLTATNDGSKTYLTKFTEGLLSQLWAFLTSGTTYGTGYQIVSAGKQASKTDVTIVTTYDESDTATDKVVDVNKGSTKAGANLITYTRSKTVKGNQSFYLINTDINVTGGVEDLDGRYHVYAPGKTTLVEIAGASKANNANVEIWTSNGGAHQDIYLQSEGNGFYSLWVMGTGKVLDVSKGSILAGTNIIQWTYGAGKANQLWSARDNGDGTYSFINKATGLALGLALADGTTPAKGANVVAAQDNGRSLNGFLLERLAILAEGIVKMQNASTTSKSLDVKGGSTEDGGEIIFWTDNGANNQRFEIVAAEGTDTYRIRTAASGGWITYEDGKAVQMGEHKTTQNDYNSWKVSFVNGAYQFTNVAEGAVLGGAGTRVNVISAPMTINTGLVRIKARLESVYLDNPASSTAAGTKYIVWTKGSGDNQKYLVEKYGSGYKIVNLASGLAVTASGKSVVQSKFTGANTQVWKVGIADNGYVKLINLSTGEALGFNADANDAGVKEANMKADTGSNEKHQSWKINISTGWYKVSGHWRYQSNEAGARFDNDLNSKSKSIGHYDVLHDIWAKIQNYTSKTKYLIASSWDSCYVGVFTGKKGNWKPYLGFNCANGSASVIEAENRALNPGSTWKWNPSWNKLLAVNNVKSKMPKLPSNNAWAAKLGTTWSTSRKRKVNAQEQYFTSVSWTLGYHTYLKSKSELGKHVSHGCQRLLYRDAKWIYENIGPGTRCIQLRTKAYTK